jgi:hypothetical protein
LVEKRGNMSKIILGIAFIALINFLWRWLQKRRVQTPSIINNDMEEAMKSYLGFHSHTVTGDEEAAKAWEDPEVCRVVFAGYDISYVGSGGSQIPVYNVYKQFSK